MTYRQIKVIAAAVRRVRIVDVVGKDTTDRAVSAISIFAFEDQTDRELRDQTVLRAGMFVPIGEMKSSEELEAFAELAKIAREGGLK